MVCDDHFAVSVEPSWSSHRERILRLQSNVDHVLRLPQTTCFDNIRAAVDFREGHVPTRRPGSHVDVSVWSGLRHADHRGLSNSHVEACELHDEKLSRLRQAVDL